MQFNSSAQGAANYLVQAGMAPDMTMTGTFNPVQQIGTTQNANSSMLQSGMAATGDLGQAINEAQGNTRSREVQRYVQRGADGAEADSRIAGAIFGGIESLGTAGFGLAAKSLKPKVGVDRRSPGMVSLAVYLLQVMHTMAMVISYN